MMDTKIFVAARDKYRVEVAKILRQLLNQEVEIQYLDHSVKGILRWSESFGVFFVQFCELPFRVTLEEIRSIDIPNAVIVATL